MVKSSTIHIILSLAITRNWPIHKLDVKKAFLHGDLHKDVYIHQSLTLLTRVCLIMFENFVNLFIDSNKHHVFDNNTSQLLYNTIVSTFPK